MHLSGLLSLWTLWILHLSHSHPYLDDFSGNILKAVWSKRTCRLDVLWWPLVASSQWNSLICPGDQSGCLHWSWLDDSSSGTWDSFSHDWLSWDIWASPSPEPLHFLHPGTRDNKRWALNVGLIVPLLVGLCCFSVETTHYEEVFLLLVLELSISLLWTKAIEQPHKVRNLNVYSVSLVIDGPKVSMNIAPPMSFGSQQYIQVERMNGLI